jgi:hypothetical protein
MTISEYKLLINSWFLSDPPTYKCGIYIILDHQMEVVYPVRTEQALKVQVNYMKKRLRRPTSTVVMLASLSLTTPLVS